MSNRLARLRPGTRSGTSRSVVTQAPWGSLRAHAVYRMHETLDVVPVVLRRLGLFLLVGSVTMAAFAVAAVVVLVHAVA